MVYGLVGYLDTLDKPQTMFRAPNLPRWASQSRVDGFRDSQQPVPPS
jgi:hypothetical protein